MARNAEPVCSTSSSRVNQGCCRPYTDPADSFRIPRFRKAVGTPASKKQREVVLTAQIRLIVAQKLALTSQHSAQDLRMQVSSLLSFSLPDISSIHWFFMIRTASPAQRVMGDRIAYLAPTSIAIADMYTS